MSAPRGTHCGNCRRSNADEPDQFRIVRRAAGGPTRLCHLCKPCERAKDARYRETKRNTERRCETDGCDAQLYVKGACRAHYRQAITPTGACIFDGCARPARPEELCLSHKRQQQAGKALAPLVQKRDPSARDADGRKQCRTCDQWLSLTRFYVNSRYSDGLMPRCRDCQRDQVMKRQYGLGLREYAERIEAQGGGCAVCGKSEQANGQMLAVDHDHSCCPGDRSCGRCVRGVLCRNCNLTLGAIGDDVAHLEALVTYLRATSPPTAVATRSSH